MATFSKFRPDGTLSGLHNIFMICGSSVQETSLILAQNTYFMYFNQILDETWGEVNLSLQWTRYFEFRVLQIVANGWKWFGCTLPQNFFGTFVLWGFPLEALVPSVPRGQNSANVSSEWLSSASGTIQHLTHPRIHIFAQIKIC